MDLERALAALDQALAKIPLLREDQPLSPAHTEFVQTTGLELGRIFGADSAPPRNFARIDYQSTGNFVARMDNMERQLKRRRRVAFLRGLDMAEGVLRSARQQLESHGIHNILAETHRGDGSDQRDAVTQLFDRAALDSALAVAADDASRQTQPLTLIFCDIDHFKQVNDLKGHQAGDDVLRQVATRLVSVVRGKGNAYRYGGGDELVALLANHTAAEGIAVAERFRRDVEKAPVAGSTVSVSVGVACLPDHAADAKGLVAAADRALYDAKKHGRNVVRLSGEPPPASTGPREPERKIPQPGGLSDQQRADLRRRLLSRQSIACPTDGATLEVLDITPEDTLVRRILIMCPECGLNERL